MDKPTGAKPREIAGHIWRCYATGVQRSEWRTDGGRWAIGQFGVSSIWWARVEGEMLRDPLHPKRTRRFRRMETAARAAVATDPLVDGSALTDSIRQMIDHARAQLALDLHNAGGEPTCEVACENIQIVLAALNSATGVTVIQDPREAPPVGTVYPDGSIQGRYGEVYGGEIWLEPAEADQAERYGWWRTGEVSDDGALVMVAK